MDRQMVGRAELKLKEAATAFGYDFRGKTVLDIGSSTGGFTEYALRAGAARVIAIEKGTRQMKAPLRYDERVSLHEKTDFLTLSLFSSATTALKPAAAQSRHDKCASFHCSASPCISAKITSSNKREDAAPKQGKNEVELVTPLQVGVDLSKVETVVADVSFVSLREILAHAKKIVPRRADYLVMLKPQFEAKPAQLVGGVVKNERMRREIMQEFERWAVRNGFVIVRKRDNETVGKVGGNRERFYWLKIAKIG